MRSTRWRRGLPQPTLFRLHLFFFLWLRVVMSHQVQEAVDKEELDLVLQGPGERLRVDAQLAGDSVAVGRLLDKALGVFEVDNHIPERHSFKDRLSRLEHREGEHIGGVVLTAPLQIERLNKRIVAQDDADLGLSLIQGEAVKLAPLREDLEDLRKLRVARRRSLDLDLDRHLFSSLPCRF